MILWLELRRALRAILREPTVTVPAVLALGLGIGLPTAMFGLLDATLLRGLPVEEPRSVMHLERRPQGASGEGWGAAARDFAGWQEQQRSFEELAAFRTGTVTLRGERGVDRWSAAWLTPNAFTVLRESAAVGRTFEERDRSGEPVIVLGHVVWRDRFDADPGVLGRTVWVDGEAHVVVGVMPPAFRFPGNEDVWLPLIVDERAVADAAFPSLDVFGRLRDGVDRDEAHAEFAVIAARMAERYPATNRDMGVAVKPFAERFLGETATAQLWVMLAAVMLVLVVACTNVANLLLVRVVHRVRELAILSALGGSRVRVLGGVLLEAGLLALAGGVVGLAVAALSIRGMDAAFTHRMPYWVDPRLDGSALVFALALTAAAALFAGVLPALKATRGNVAGLLNDQSRGSTSLRLGRVMQGLVVVEIALSLALLLATGLLVRGALHVRGVEFGFATEQVLTARLTLPPDYGEGERIRFYDALLAEVGSSPQVAGVALATSLPADRAARQRFAVQGETYASEDARPAARRVVATPSFFETFALRPLAGRTFGPQDGPDALPVAVVNQRFVARHMGASEPIGSRIRFGEGEAAEWRTIVGVVPDLWMGGFDASEDRNPAGVYVPLSQAAPAGVSVAIRTRGTAPVELVRPLREAAFGIDGDVPIFDVRTMPQLVRDNSWFYDFAAGIMGVTGITALLLAAIGLYGVIAFTVGKRLREFGIRMAVGATGGDVLRLVMRRGAIQLGIGLAIGMVLGLGLGRGVGGLLFDVSPTDPVVYTVVALLLAAVGATATLIPALRAARVQPLSALRAE